MIDKEKVIKGLSCCAKWMDENDIDACNSCPYHRNYNDDDHGCIGEVNNDAIALLKEQKAVTEYVIDEFQPTCKACGFRPFAGYIPTLEWMKERGFKFCPQCGKVVKWE